MAGYVLAMAQADAREEIRSGPSDAEMWQRLIEIAREENDRREDASQDDRTRTGSRG
jgi:hypothetical protein